VYIDPTGGRYSYTCYTYFINGSGELELGSAGYTIATLTKTGGGGEEPDPPDDTLTSDIDASLLGTWKDKPAGGYGTPGDVLTVTFTETSITWGGTAGDILNTSLAVYQSYGSYAWEVKNSSINLVYIDPSIGRYSYTCYTYAINGDGELELQAGGVTFATLTQIDTRPPADVSGLVGIPSNGQVTLT
jgi:hypothetical protein